jgi:hypothetical protein
MFRIQDNIKNVKIRADIIFEWENREKAEWIKINIRKVKYNKK